MSALLEFDRVQIKVPSDFLVFGLLLIWLEEILIINRYELSGRSNNSSEFPAEISVPHAVIGFETTAM